MSFKHCTIDLETMDNRPTAAITAIGVVLFDLEGNRAEFECNIDLESSIQAGLTTKGETIMWWMNQSKAAQKALTDPKPVDLRLGLEMMNAFIRANRAKGFTCWTHATFDAPIMNYAMSLIDVKPAIHFREHRDIRTLTWLARQTGMEQERLKFPNDLTAHRAIDDARNQANYISRLLSYFTPPEEENENTENTLPAGIAES